MLLVHLSISFVNYRHAAYLNLMSEGETRTDIAPAPVLPQVPSQYTFHGMSMTGPSI
jgi:hypothetical protein